MKLLSIFGMEAQGCYVSCLTILGSNVWKKSEIGKIDGSCLEFLIGGSKVAKNLRLEARQLLARLHTIFGNLRLMGRKWSCL